MRSDDLASEVEHDQSFLVALRARLAEEPVVLAPARLPSPAPAAIEAALSVAAAGGRRARWGVPVAMAAGVMVTGALVMSNLAGTRQAEVQSLPIAVAESGPAAASASERDPAGPIEVGNIVRDPELDRYLNAHRQFVGGNNLAVPGGVRQVAVVQDGR